MQVALKQRMTKGLMYQIAYTYSKGMSDAIGYYGSGGLVGSQSAYWQNLRDKRSEWGPTFFDQQQTFVANYVYELPFGRGRQFGADINPALDAVLGGWQVSGVLTSKSGFPWTIRGPDRSGTVSRGYRADRVGDGAGPEQVGPGAYWFDRAAFKDPAAGTFGNSGNGVVRGPGYSTWDLGVEKSFKITESQQLQFRTEFLNLTNSPIFQGADRTVTSPTFAEITSSQGERVIQFGLRYEF